MPNAQLNQASKSDALLEFIKAFSEIAIPIGAIIYIAGWSYLQSYYATFGLPAGILDIPLNQVLVQGFSIILSAAWWILLSSAALIAIHVGGSKRVASWPGPWLLVFILLLITARWGLHFGSINGQEFATTTRHHKKVKYCSFVLSDEAARRLPPRFLNANKDANLILVAETASTYYAMQQRVPEKDDLPTLPFAHLYHLQKRDVRLADVILPNIPNQGSPAVIPTPSPRG